MGRKVLKEGGKFLNYSTDEIFGSAPAGVDYKESDRWRPSNPYSAAKAGQSALGYAWYNTYGLPVISTQTMNIFGERQNPEKLVPKAIQRVFKGEPMPVHCKIEDGKVVDIGTRKYLHARNAANATVFLLKHGVPGEFYNIVGDVELDNKEVVDVIADIMGKKPVYDFVDFHSCRPGHDRRYSLDGSKLAAMGWTAPLNFYDSMKKTVEWTLEHKEDWMGGLK
jgi:dTDP-glucose 4,6-dehydratase